MPVRHRNPQFLFVAFACSLLFGCDAQIAAFIGKRGGFTSIDVNQAPEPPAAAPSNPTPPAPAPVIPKIIQKVVAGMHACVASDQGLECWGANYLGELGVIGAATVETAPRTVFSTPVQDVALGTYHTCVLVDGGVKCVGSGTSGQLGQGSSANSTTFVEAMATGSGVTSIRAGGNNTCAVKSGGLFCWGAGYVGDGSTVVRNSPTQIFAPGSGVTQVAMGSYHTCALVAGEAWCWGQNWNGQVGDGTLVAKVSPVKIAALGVGIDAIYAGDQHSCALKAGGLLCWGYNATGQVGDNSTTTRSSPVVVFAAGNAVTQAALGSGHSCALVNSQLKCWGDNSLGQLNDNASLNPHLAPTLVLDATANVTAIASGANSMYVVEGVSKLIFWGGGSSGAGSAGSSLDWVSPEQVLGMTSGVTAIANTHLLNDDGVYQNCAIQNGGVKCWGVNNYGALGDGTTNSSNSPVVAVAEFSGATDVAVISGTTNASSCAVVNGGVQCWGNGYSTSPMQIVPAASAATQIRMAQYSSFFDSYNCAVVNGGVQCWGRNSFGQLGNGTTTNSPTTPVTAIAASSGVTKIEIKQGSSCAILNGGLSCWGLNESGQLGDGTVVQKTTPTQIFASGSNVTDVVINGNWSSPGGATTCAVVNGGLKCWGNNAISLVGDGTTVNRSSPVDIFSAGSGVTKVFGGNYSMCAIKNSGLYCWGLNPAGSLGVGDLVARTTPTLVIAEGSGVTAGEVGYALGCAIVNGGLKCWGGNGLVGDGTISARLSPVSIFPPASGVQEVRLPYESIVCARINSALKCWGNDSGYRLIGNGKVTRGFFSAIGYEL